jgi:hypothetical protein
MSPRTASDFHTEFKALFAPDTVTTQGDTVTVVPPPTEVFADPTGSLPFRFTGTLVSMHETGHAAVRLIYVNGQMHGERTEYYRDGVLQDRRHYSHGIAVGVRRFWFPNGARWGDEHYVDGKLHGTNTYWHMEGPVALLYVYEHGKMVSQQEFAP